MRIWGKSMGKKILIGSMLVLTLLLLMPSIPAIQQNTIEDNSYSNLVDKLDDDIKHQLLYNIIYMMIDFRLMRGLYLKILSSNFLAFNQSREIYYPIVYYRGEWLQKTAIQWGDFWQKISDENGWNWHFGW